MTAVVPAGFVSVNPQTGARAEFDVTPIFLPDLSTIVAPVLNIGVLGDARVGNFTFESRMYFDWPRNTPGASTVGVQTSQSLTGLFVAVRVGPPG